MNKIDEIKKQLVWKVKDSSNTNTIFDKKKYLLYDDVIKILNEVLIIDSVIVPKGTFCSLYNKECMGNICSVTPDFKKCKYFKEQNAL